MHLRSRVLVRSGIVLAVVGIVAGAVAVRDNNPSFAPRGVPSGAGTIEGGRVEPAAPAPRLRQAPPGSKPGYDPTVAACSPARVFDAVFYGSGPVCAPWDSIPAIDAPEFVSALQVDYLEPDESIIVLDLGGDHRAYPVRILLFHEIVNDVVGGEPVAITFCPLCNSAVGFSRRIEGETLVFGVSGQLNFANLLMFDRQTFSLWRQLSGEAVEGPCEGSRLSLLPVHMVPFGEWRGRIRMGGSSLNRRARGSSTGSSPIASTGSTRTSRARS